MNNWQFIGWWAAFWVVTIAGIILAGYAVAYSLRQIWGAWNDGRTAVERRLEQELHRRGVGA